MVDQEGAYTRYLTDDVAGQKRTGTGAGTLSLSNGLIIDTMTKDLTSNTRVPRTLGVYGVVDWGCQFLSLADENGSNRVVYLRVTNIISSPQSTNKIAAPSLKPEATH
jgi:hypothetical protein